MRSDSEPRRGAVRRLLGRIDVRLTVLLAGLTAAFTSALLCGLVAYATVEALEEQFAVLDGALATVDDAVTRGVPVGPLHAGIAYRVVDGAGRERDARGAWPPPDVVRAAPTLRSALGARDGDQAVRERVAPTGWRVAATLPLHHFVRERRELVVRGAGVVVVGLLGSLLIGIVGARRALRPLRATTAAIRAIEPRRLDARIAVRGTGDDVDALAGATNEVLARLEWSFARLSAFSADVAHELRTPVNRVLNAAEVALTTSANGAGNETALATIHAAAEAMRRTVEQLLLLAKGEDGRLRLEREPVELGSLLEGLAELYAPMAEQMGKSIARVPSSATLPLDRELIERAVVNLLENALVHGADGATIRLGVETSRDGAAVVVEDSGPGVGAQDHERIFGRFVRLDDARAPGGAGLGLPIARMIARLHGGDLTVGTSALGGAAFRLVLPADGAGRSEAERRRASVT